MCEYCENTFSNKRNKNLMEGELKTFTGVPLCKFRTYLDVNQFNNTPELKTDLFTYENYTEPENGTKLRELVISGGMKEINYCPYCGKRLNLKAPKLRSMREIYDTFGWKPEGWDIDDFDILDPKNPREENSEGGYIFGKPDEHIEVIDRSSLHPCPQNSKEENEKLKKLINSVFGVPKSSDALPQLSKETEEFYSRLHDNLASQYSLVFDDGFIITKNSKEEQ